MRLFLSLSVLTILAGSARAQSEADVCVTADKVVKCFHSTATYLRCERIAPGRVRIYFKGAITKSPYHLEVLAQSRADGFTRLLLLDDTARIPASGHCPLAEWHSQ